MDLQALLLFRFGVNMKFDSISEISDVIATNFNLQKTLTMPGSLFVAEGKARWRLRSAGAITEVHISAGEAPAGRGLICALGQDGILTGTTFELPVGEHAVSLRDLNIAFEVGQYFTLDVTQIGVSNPGKNVTFTFVYHVTPPLGEFDIG